MVESCDLFFDQELPHTDRIVCGCIIMVEEPLLVIPQCPPAASNSVMEANQNLLVEALIHPQAQIHDEPNPSGQKMQSI